MENFPDEVILKVLSYLNLRDLIFCGQLSKRIRTISHDESLWENINLHHQNVTSKFLEMILNNGCKYLNLHDAKLIGNSSLASKSTQLLYLDLSSTFGWDEKSKEKLLLSCQSLQKLWMKKEYLNSNIITAYDRSLDNLGSAFYSLVNFFIIFTSFQIFEGWMREHASEI